MSRAIIVYIASPESDEDITDRAVALLQERARKLGFADGTRFTQELGHRLRANGWKLVDGELQRYVEVVFFAEEPVPSSSDVIEVRVS